MPGSPVAQPDAPIAAPPLVLVERGGLRTPIAAADQAAEAAAELRRWYVFLGVPFVLSAVFFMGAIGTERLWLVGGALVTGPGLLIMAFIYLALGSDTNGDS